MSVNASRPVVSLIYDGFSESTRSSDQSGEGVFVQEPERGLECRY
jgi:hypothetical protein